MNSIINLSELCTPSLHPETTKAAARALGSSDSHFMPVQNTEADATSASSILATLNANSTGYVQVANSLLVALGQNKSSGVESAIRDIVNNQTGNTSYPATAINNTVRLTCCY